MKTSERIELFSHGPRTVAWGAGLATVYYALGRQVDITLVRTWAAVFATAAATTLALDFIRARVEDREAQDAAFARVLAQVTVKPPVVRTCKVDDGVL